MIKEPRKSVHITLQLRRETLFCLILLFVAFYSTEVPLTFSKVVLFVSKFLTCTMKRVKTGKKKIEVIMQNKNRHNKQYFSRSSIYWYLKVKNYWKVNRSYERTAIDANTDRIAIEASDRSKKVRKKINLLRFFLPTQLLIQVQWWSYCFMQTPQISQW